MLLSLRHAVVVLLLLRTVASFFYQVKLNTVRKTPLRATPADVYADYWRQLLVAEQREAVAELKARRASWSHKRLEESGIVVFDASAEPESDMFGEKIVRIYKEGETRFQDRFARGDILVMTTVASTLMGRRQQAIPKECCIVDVGKDWMTVAVGPSWPHGLWEARRLPGSFTVRLDKTAPHAPLKAQSVALELVRRGEAGDAASLLVDTFRASNYMNTVNRTSEPPLRFKNYSSTDLEKEVRNALAEAMNSTAFEPNQSQQDAIVWALCRRISLLVGPPGTGKTRVAAMLVSTALRLPGIDASSPARVLAVAHSNGAADVLLEALLEIGIPAIRVGRPASVSTNVRHRTVIAMAEKHPEVVSLRQQSRDITVDSHLRSHLVREIKHCVTDVCQSILKTCPVIVSSCVGAQQLLEDNAGVAFPLVVVDEAAQTTEPGLLCALAASRAEQIVFVGDTRQLPPTVASEAAEIRESLGVSPMARLEKSGVEQQTLQIQYRMAPALLEHPSSYFYDGLVTCAGEVDAGNDDSVAGFPWPRPDAPLAFVHVGTNLEATHEFGGKSNPTEASLVADIVQNLLMAGDVEAQGVAVITPYSKQVQRIRIELSMRRNVRDIRVGTVDSFQGQETDVVLFSAVRSNSEKEMGFLRDPRRLCVAITRARRGLIIVGDQSVLRSSHHWRALIDSCQERGCVLDAGDISFEEPSFATDKLLPDGSDDVNDGIDSLLIGLLDESDELLGLFDS